MNLSFCENYLVPKPFFWGGSILTGGIEFQVFRDIRMLPKGPGVYIMVNRPVIGAARALYVGESIDIWKRFNSPRHEKLNRAFELGMTEVHVHGPVANDADRIERETLVRNTIWPSPPLNEQGLTGVLGISHQANALAGYGNPSPVAILPNPLAGYSPTGSTTTPSVPLNGLL
jgi:hypothetical protein